MRLKKERSKRMREGIAERLNDGSLLIHWKKVIGKGYTRGWFTNCHARYRLFKGARATKKSTNMIGYETIAKILSDERRNILVIRKNDENNRQTTYATIVRCMGDLGFVVGKQAKEGVDFVASKNPLEITYVPTGQKIVFRGMNDPTTLNGITFEVGALTDVYIDEVFEIQSYDDFLKLDGTLRVPPPGITLQITMCFNAWSADHWLYTYFFRNHLEDDFETLDDPDRTFMDYMDPDWEGPFGKGLYLHTSTYKVNEFRDKENYDRSAAAMKKGSAELYRVHFLGMWGNATESTYPEFIDHEKTLVLPWDYLCGQNGKGQFNKYYRAYAIGIDTGYSKGDGKKIIVTKDQNPSERVKAATTMSLVAVTQDMSQMVTLEEYYHTRIPQNRMYNTDEDKNANYDAEALVAHLVAIIMQWKEKYKNIPVIMKGRIPIFLDSADNVSREMLVNKSKNMAFDWLNAKPSQKTPIDGRVEWYRYMMALDSFLVCSNCQNLIRELKSARMGEKGEVRVDGNDHMINANEYGFAPSLLREVKAYSRFKNPTGD